MGLVDAYSAMIERIKSRGGDRPVGRMFLALWWGKISRELSRWLGYVTGDCPTIDCPNILFSCYHGDAPKNKGMWEYRDRCSDLWKDRDRIRVLLLHLSYLYHTQKHR